MTPTAVDQQEWIPSSNSPALIGSKREFWLVVAALTLLYVIAVAIGNRRNVWYDELFTFDIARSTSLRQLWHRELRFDNHTPDNLPPEPRFHGDSSGILHWAFAFRQWWSFTSEVSQFCLYVRRKAGIAFATVAVLLLWATVPNLYYAVEARPYALIFLSFSCLLLSWDTAITSQARPVALFGVAASTLALAVAHMFAVFTLFAFVVAETIRLLRRRKPDYPLWAALLLPMLSMLIYIPLIRASENIVFAVHPSFHTTIFFFEDMLGSPIISVVLLALLLIPAPQGSRSTITRFQSEEIALLACMFLSPILLNLLLMHRQGTFYNRYCLPSQVAILAALVILLPHRMRLSRWAAYAGSILLASVHPR